MKRYLNYLIIFSLVLFLLNSCNLGIDFGGFFYSYSNPDSRFSEKDTLQMHSAPTLLESISASSGKLSYSFTIISDIHVRDSGAPHLEQFVKSLLLPEDQFILDCGDSTQSGYNNQFTIYRDIMDSSGIPWFASIGNHDLYHEGWKFYRETIGKSVYTLNIGSPGDRGSTLVISLDSANSTLGKKQINWLEDILFTNSGLWDHIIVYTHSQFFSDGLTTVVQFSDTEEIYKLMYLFKTYGVEYVFMGHNHKWNQRTIDGVKYITLDPLQKKGSEDSFVRVTVDGSEISHSRIMIPGY